MPNQPSLAPPPKALYSKRAYPTAPHRVRLFETGGENWRRAKKKGDWDWGLGMAMTIGKDLRGRRGGGDGEEGAREGRGVGPDVDVDVDVGVEVEVEVGIRGEIQYSRETERERERERTARFTEREGWETGEEKGSIPLSISFLGNANQRGWRVNYISCSL